MVCKSCYDLFGSTGGHHRRAVRVWRMGEGMTDGVTEPAYEQQPGYVEATQSEGA